jgi:predicted ferric reductase
MSLNPTPPSQPTASDSTDRAQNVILVILIIVAGVLLTINLMPLWLPTLSLSMLSDQPKIYWFLSRGSAISAYWLLWLSMSSGIIITNKLAKIWPGIPPSYEVHQFTSLLGLGLALFHALILSGDQYIHYTILQVLLPFASQNYKPLWVGIGQVAFYSWILINASFYLRQRIGKKMWRAIHFLSYASFTAIMVHGIYSGTDAATNWAKISYWFSAGTILFLTVYRILSAIFPSENKKPSGKQVNGVPNAN